MKFLFVTKDAMAFRGLSPIAQQLRALGHIIIVLATGKSKEMWTGLEVPFDMIEEGDPDEIIQQVQPAIVLTGLSSPIDIEDTIAEAAKRKQIKVVVFSDTWGATSRMKLGQPDLILTTDNVDRVLALANFPRVQVVNVGDWMTSPITGPDIWDKAYKSLFIAGQNPVTIKEFVEVTLTKMQNPTQWQVAFKPHPKYKDDPKTLEALRLLTRSGVQMLETSASGDKLAATADIIVSGFSGVLRVAALHGKIAVSVDSPTSVEQMKKSTGLSEYPLVSIKACYATNGFGSLEDLYFECTHIGPCERYRRSVWPARLDEAVDRILGLV